MAQINVDFSYKIKPPKSQKSAFVYSARGFKMILVRFTYGFGAFKIYISKVVQALKPIDSDFSGWQERSNNGSYEKIGDIAKFQVSSKDGYIAKAKDVPNCSKISFYYKTETSADNFRVACSINGNFTPFEASSEWRYKEIDVGGGTFNFIGFGDIDGSQDIDTPQKAYIKDLTIEVASDANGHYLLYKMEDFFNAKSAQMYLIKPFFIAKSAQRYKILSYFIKSLYNFYRLGIDFSINAKRFIVRRFDD